MRLIDADALKEIAHEMIEEDPEAFNGGYSYDAVTVGEIDDAPTIDAVPVVRCKDCKHYNKDVCWCNMHSHFIDCDGYACRPWESNDWKMFDEDDFCSDGEKKEGVI